MSTNMKQSQRDVESTSSCDDAAVNQRLSLSLMRLKFEDRNEIEEEIHGVRSLARAETPELINQSLVMMNVELERIISMPNRKYEHAFETARRLPKTFVNDRDFRLRFLRSELFDPAKAAERMIAYLDYRLHLFGSRALSEPLTLNSFNEQESVALRDGGVQLLPFRDRSGRRILVLLSKSLSLKPFLRVKLVFYLINTMSEDEETQRKGMITVAWLGSPTDKIIIPGTPGSDERVIIQSGITVAEALPVRVVAIHFWLPDTPLFRLLKSFYTFGAPVKSLSRYKFHIATRTEMKYKMMSYGIPVSQIPETENGVTKTKNHSQWLKVRRMIENDPIAREHICVCPGMNDVLFRRAGSCKEHPGNSTFKNFIESKKDEHGNANQIEKKLITMSVVQMVQRRKGRFFKWSTAHTCWLQITDYTEMRQKVAMSIRDFNRQSKAAQNRQSTKSSTLLFQADNENTRKRKNVDQCMVECVRPVQAAKFKI